MVKMIKFVVFECKRFSKNRSFARIHRASCSFAKKPSYKTDNTLCHGYFDGYFEALDFAESLNVGRVYDCELCSPMHYDNRAREEAEG